MAIRKLPQNLINQIAAGEVIERPASAVKELVENSIDAGADEINIQTKNGGKTSIIISDNGSGMTKEDLELSVMRHATSKLKDNDLTNINFLGFRGEAVPSIASISKMKIKSSSSNSKESYEICIEGGEQKYIKPAPYIKGTRTEITDLFYATPARLKFLKTDQTESAYITDIVKKIALSAPHISFNLNNKLKLNAGTGDFLESLFKRTFEILGKEFKENALPLNAEKEDIKISGFIAKPTYNKNNTLSQYIFVNKRPVNDKLIKSAIRAGYLDTMFHGRFPVLALFVEVPSYFVDVNVHPAKAEVRFKNPGLVRSLIVSSIKKTIAAAEQNFKQTENYQNNISNTNRTYQTTNLPPYIKEENLTNSFEYFKPDEKINLEEILNKTDETSDKQFNDSVTPTNFGIPKAQIHNAFIITETENGMLIIDQHAAHERIVYEKLRKQKETNSIKTQMLLIPEVIELSEMQFVKIMEIKNNLSKIGFVIEKLGANTITVLETPSILNNRNIKAIFINLAEELEEEGTANSLEKTTALILKTVACHGSIRAGRRLNFEEMYALLQEMEKTENIGQCNHGRPSYIKLSKNDIEKMFLRI